MNEQGERELLLACLSESRGQASVSRLEGLGIEDWVGIVRRAVRCRVAPLLHHRLRDLSPGVAIPTSTRRELRDIYFFNAGRNLYFYNELAEIAALLRKENVPVIVLKGAYLAEAVYARRGLRQMGDLDLLVKATDLARVEKRMLELGFSPDPLNQTEHAELCSHLAYIRPEMGLLVEVHWDIEGSPSAFNVDVDGLWERSRRTSVAGVQVSALSTEDLLLHLCLHASFHHLFIGGVQSLADIAEMLRHDEEQPDWAEVRDRARQWGASHCVFLTLYLAWKLLDAAVPDAVLKDLRPSDFNEHYAAWAEDRMFDDADSSDGCVSDNWGRLLKCRRLSEGVPLLFRIALPNKRVLARMYSVPLGSRRVYLYYPIHVADLVRRHGHRAWRLLRGDVKTRAWIEGQGRRVEEASLKEQVLQHGERTTGWIRQDARRVEQLAILQWLASA